MECERRYEFGVCFDVFKGVGEDFSCFKECGCVGFDCYVYVGVFNGRVSLWFWVSERYDDVLNVVF